MNGHRDDASGPVIQKRDVFFVAGLLVSWIAVVVFLVQTAKNKSHQAPLNPPMHAHPADIIIEDAIQPAYEDEAPLPLSREAITTILKSMRDRSGTVERPFGTLITAEPAPPALVENGSLTMEQPVTPEIDQEAGGVDDAAQEGELLGPETPEPANPPEAETPAPAPEPIKS